MLICYRSLLFNWPSFLWITVVRLGSPEVLEHFEDFWGEMASCPSCSLTSTWPHMICDVGLEEGEHRENCLCLAVLCTIIMVHKDTSSSSRTVQHDTH